MQFIAEDSERQDQELVGERFRLQRLLGRGFAGRVYQATDLDLSRECALRIIDSAADGSLSSYGRHLAEVSSALIGVSLPAMEVPYHYEDRLGVAVVASNLLEGTNLEQVLAVDGSLSPGAAAKLFAALACGLAELHRIGFIHGDVKPANVLVKGSLDRGAVLIDFGMIRPTSATSFQMVGTYSYVHPDLKSPGARPDDLRSRRGLRQAHSAPMFMQTDEHAVPDAGVDIYALGQSIYYSLVGDTLEDSLLPKPSDYTDHAARHVVDQVVMSARRHGYRESELGAGGAVLAFAQLLIAMLQVPIDADSEDTQRVCDSLSSLAADLRLLEAAVSAQSEVPSPPGPRPRAYPGSLEDAVADIGRVAKELDSATYIVTSERGSLRIEDASGSDEVAMQTLASAHANARSRTKMSWLFGMGLTMLGALAVVGLAVVTVWEAVAGNVAWSFVFGGASIASLLGTLHFAPYDRVFRATVLATEIDMVYVRVVTVFQGTRDLGERSKALREADGTLCALLRMPLSGATPEDTKGRAGD